MTWLYVAMAAIYVIVLAAVFVFLKNADDRREDAEE